MKKLLCAVLAAVMLFCLLPPGVFASAEEGETPQVILGDLDGDGNVASADARLVLRASVKLEPIEEGTSRFLAADVDCDGSLTPADARIVLRVSVGLQEFPVRKPEREVLSEKELQEKVGNGGLFKISAKYEYDTAIGVGFAIEDGKTLVCRLSLIHYADRITVSRTLFDGTVETFKVVGVEGYDAVNDIALLKLDHAGKAFELLPGDPSMGEKAYYFSEFPYYTCYPSDPESFNAAPDDLLGRKILSFRAPDERHSSESGTPMLDCRGRVIGIWLSRDDQDSGCFYATPASVINRINRSDPMSFAAFKKIDRVPVLVGGYQDVTVLPYATVFIPVLLDSYEETELNVQTSRPDLLKVSWAHVGYRVYVVIVRVVKPCENVPVTVSVHTSYGDASVVSVVSTSDDAYLNVVGYPFAPDPGALWEISPDTVWIDDAGFAHLQFSKKDFRYSDEEMFQYYAGILLENGFEYDRTDEEPDGWCYVFCQKDGSAFIRYHDAPTCVDIEIAEP